MNQRLCSQCNSRVYEELPGGLCPRCLMAVAARVSHTAVTGTYPQTGRTAPPSEVAIAELFPELEVFELIGQGGMGAVYRVRQKNLDRIVALKVFLGHPDDAEFAARFQREARALAKLNHPNIVTVHDFGVRGDVHYLVMEFVDGMNLRQLASVERVSPKIALQMVPQLCDALQYAHDQGIIHRDIKPENLLISTSGGIKIADFGLAKMTGLGLPDSLTRTEQVMGTFNYMAPEQRDRPTEVDHRADIYSLGVVIYELLTGELPLGRFQPPSSKSDIDARLDEAVMRALEREPARRYQQASEFKTGLSQHDAAMPTPAVNPFAANLRPDYFNSPTPPVKPSTGLGSALDAGTRYMFTLMSGRERKGNWNAEGNHVAVTVMGGVELDLTQVTAKEVDITLITFMGGVDVIVPPGAQVDLDGFMLMGAITDKVVAADSPSTMKVRIRAWGAMGECEVRSPKKNKKWNLFPKAAAPDPKSAGHKPLQTQAVAANGTSLGRGLVALYQLLAILVSVSIPLMILFRKLEMHDLANKIFGFEMVDFEISKLGIVLVALTAGMLWSGLFSFRVLVRGGAAGNDETAVQEYESATVLGAGLRWLAIAAIFACPMFLTIAGDDRDDQIFRYAGVACAIIAIGLFAMIKPVEQMLHSAGD